MMEVKRFLVVIVLLSCVAMISPTAIMAAPVKNTPRDVALHKGGVLVGQMLDAQGAAVVAVPVSVKTAGKEIAKVRTDQQGKFQVRGLRGGVHVVAAGGQQGVYRLWAPRTAPPAARQGLMLVPSTDIVRGQCGCGTSVGCGTPVCGKGCGFAGIGGWMDRHPVVTVGAIATAIAVPLALDDDDDPPATP